jgi:ureidoglycolate hydrolase
MNMGMGFTEGRVTQALRASFDNPDQAVELLLNVWHSPHPA